MLNIPGTLECESGINESNNLTKIYIWPININITYKYL